MQFLGGSAFDPANPGTIGAGTAASATFSTLTTTGTTILASTSATLLGFHGQAAVAQRQSSVAPAVATTAAINSSISSSCFGYTSAQAAAIVALVNELRAALVQVGMIAT